MSWQDVANQSLGAEAPGVIQALSSVNPNYDWSAAILQNAAGGQGQDGWFDPSRDAPASVAWGTANIAAQLDPANRGWLTQAANGNLDAARQQQVAQIQQEQGSHGGGGGLGGLLGLAGLAAGAYFGIPALGEALGAGAGLSEGAAWGAGLGAGSADAAAMQGAVGLGGGGMDLGGGLSIDEFGNVTNGLFQGGPGTAGAGDFFSGGASGLDFGGMNLNNASQIAQIARALGIGGGGSQMTQQGGGQPGQGGFDLSKLLPLLGIGSGLNTMFNRPQAVDPSRVNALWQAGQNTYNTAQDPQNQLHDFLQQQTVDNSRAATSARGIGMSGNAAGIENDATRNFNMDWQNQQLARQAQGTQAFAQAGNVGAQSGLANNAQAFTQNQTGLNNLTTGLGQIFGNNGLFGPGQGTNGVGSWLTSMFSGGPAATPATSYDTSMIGQGVG